MIPVFNSADVRAMDAAAMASGISGLTLMENAALALYDALCRALGGVEGRRIVIFAGAGNNGGDGFALGRILLSHGAETEIIYTGEDARTTADCALMREKYEAVGGKTGEIRRDCLLNADACVDAMFGIGFRGKLSGAALEAARQINRAECFRLAADIPSGIYSDYGGMCEDAVQVDCTVTFIYPKPSCLLLPAAMNCGRVITADIGVSEALTEGHRPVFWMSDEGELAVLPKRPRNAYKNQLGRVLIVGGSGNYTGAAYLAAQSAVLSGAGLVNVAVPRCLHSAMAVKLTEAMVRALPDEEYAGDSSLYELLNLCVDADAVLIGPGMGRENETVNLIHDICSMMVSPLVLDADGINAFEGNIDILTRLPHQPILTPHDGEYARLFGAPPPADGRARVMTVMKDAKSSNCTIVLKGHRTIIAAPDGRVCVNSTGNPGMAKGGSGDVLAGIVASLRAQGLEPFDAACTAVWLHGTAGDECARVIGEYGMTPTDVMEAVPGILKSRNSIKYFK